MRKSHILATVSTFALGAMIGLSPGALADPPAPAVVVATFAYAFNDGHVTSNWAWLSSGGNSATITGNTANGASGILQLNQNAGPNSQLQNAAAVASVAANAGSYSTTAVAYAYNWGQVYNNLSQRTLSNNAAEIFGSFDGVTGVLNVNQNAGDNSLLQNASALAVFRDCAECTERTRFSGSFAWAGNSGSIDRNAAITEEISLTTARIVQAGANATGVLQLNQNAGANSLLQNAAAVASIEANGGPGIEAVARAYNWGWVHSGNVSRRFDDRSSAAISDSFAGVEGVLNVNQNVGNNSLLQNATAVASFEDCNCVRGGSAFTETFAWASNEGFVGGNFAATFLGQTTAQITDGTGNGAQGVLQLNQNAGANSGLQNAASVASIRAFPGLFTSEVSHAFNWGSVAGNQSTRGYQGSFGTSNTASIRDSFNDGTRGVLQVNQNAGDNSLLQNSAAIAALRYCGTNCASVNLQAVAVAGNWGTVSGNRAEAHDSTATAVMSSSFRGFQGVLNVNQNAGANSLLQNATAVSTIRPARN